MYVLLIEDNPDLVVNIADRQGWQLAVDSREGHGAVFRLRFAPLTASFTPP
jgi:signal transduction histidine kinase